MFAYLQNVHKLVNITVTKSFWGICMNLKLLSFGLILLTSGCLTENKSQLTSNLSLSMQAVHEADITVDTTKKLKGEASSFTLFGFITLGGPTDFAEGLLVQEFDGSIFFVNSFRSLKSAAIYDAAWGKTDVLVSPQWALKTNDFILFKTEKMEVTGYPGKMNGIHQIYAGNFRHDVSTHSEPANKGNVLEEISNQSIAFSNLEKETIIDIVSGQGPKAVKGDTVCYQYTCALKDGTVLYDSRNQGVARNRIAGGGLIPIGLSDGLVGCRKGMHRLIEMPPEMAYGSAGSPKSNIPPNSALVFNLYIESVRQN